MIISNVGLYEVFPVSEKGENGLGDEGADVANATRIPPPEFLARTVPGSCLLRITNCSRVLIYKLISNTKRKRRDFNCSIYQRASVSKISTVIADCALTRSTSFR